MTIPMNPGKRPKTKHPGAANIEREKKNKNTKKAVSKKGK